MDMDSPLPPSSDPTTSSPSPHHQQSQSLPQKYQKLATEYAKLRSSAGVLKRGLLEEQAKSAQLTDDLLTRDQTIRKKDQEIDSLSFRNTQLEKRVGVLQTELAVSKAKGHGKSSSSGGLFHKSSTSNSGDSGAGAGTSPAQSQQLNYNLNSELITKIEENIQLQRRISVLEEQSSQVREELEAKENSRIRDLEIQLNNLFSENLSLQNTVQNSLDEIEAYREQVGQLQGKILELNHQGNGKSGPGTTNSNSNCRRKHTSNNFSGSGDFGSEEDEPSSSESHSQSCPCPLVAPPVSQETLLEKLKSLEMDKEQWVLEYHLLEVRLKRALSKLDETTKILKSLGYEEPISSPTTEGASTPSANATTTTTTTTIVGSIESTSPVTITLDPLASTIQSHCMSRIQTLISLLQDSDSRALTFYDEVKNMEKLLNLSNERRLKIEQEFGQLRDKYQSLEGDLELVKENYEGQLVAMSEHVVELNERIMSGHSGHGHGTGKRK